jgi:hypothetical protein
MKKILVSLLFGLTVLGCAGQNTRGSYPQPTAPPPPPPSTDVTAEVNSYIADIRSLIAEMENVKEEADSLPDIGSLKENPVFKSTMKLLDSFYLESLKAHNIQLLSDKIHEFEERTKETTDINTYQLIRGIIGYHARFLLVTINIASLSKKIDAMEPRLHDLKNKLILAYSQNPYGANYVAISAILRNEQTRFIRKTEELWEYLGKSN